MTDERRSAKSDSRDELRTVAFRLREIQRLLAMRVSQENRRLAADGVEPVTEADFFRREDATEATPERTD